MEVVKMTWERYRLARGLVGQFAPIRHRFRFMEIRDAPAGECFKDPPRLPRQPGHSHCPNQAKIRHRPRAVLCPDVLLRHSYGPNSKTDEDRQLPCDHDSHGSGKYE
jgi:hypothetical protein